ncbi:MAG: putative porin [Bacteroidales bacterium]|nr:putative porin [Bacteroidales bacterium]
MNHRFFRSVICLLTFLLLFVGNASGQSSRSSSSRSGGNAGRKNTTAVDSSKIVPIGLKTWTVDRRFGSVIPTEPDTMPHLFQQVNNTDGIYGTYNHTGNLASPRITRIYSGQQDFMMGSQFLFANPYSMAMESAEKMVFTNTKSPITNISWMTQGNKTNGDDRIRVNFATNINKNAGIGAKIDYFYGRGYYTHQNTSSIASRIFGSYRGERYQVHGAYILDRTKNAENGGLTDDTYITHPEYFSTKYAPQDMPVRLRSAYNNMKVNTLFLTHRYNLGYYELVDSLGEKLVIPDSLRGDSTILRGPRKFIPVAAFVHTAKFDHNRHVYLDNTTDRSFYIDDFFVGTDSINDPTRYLSLENTFALEMTEGFRRWVKTGMRLFGKHQLLNVTLPDEEHRMVGTTYNYITLGAQLMRELGRLFHYNVLGEIRTTGKKWGEFNVEGNMKFDIPILRDSVSIVVDGFVRNEEPSYYYRHYHSAGAWWDNDLSNIFRTRVNGTLLWRKTRLKVGVETIQNHTFFQEVQDWTNVANPEGSDISQVRYGACVSQASKNVQLLQAALCQDLKFGPVVWENEVTFQRSSDNKVLPVPTLNVWSNLYFHFKIAKVLSTDIGGDVRYFTRYYAPTYTPFLGQYAVQDEDHRVKVGNYPWVNIYANFHLKTCRFFVMYSHVSQYAGPYFLAPHYPTNQRALRLGISWNFFN